MTDHATDDRADELGGTDDAGASDRPADRADERADDGPDVAGPSVDRRSVLSAAAGAGAATLFPAASGVASASDLDLDEPTGVHVAYGPDATTAARIGWTSDGATESYVEYGEADDGEPSTRVDAEALVVPGDDLVAYDAGLTGLNPGTEYVYRVVKDGTATGPYTFRTAPGPDATEFTVTAVGDHGIDDPDNEFQRADDDSPVRVIDRARSFDPAFHLGVGDIAYANGYPFTWDTYFEAFEEFYAGTPFMTVPGNHEKVPGQGFSQYDARLNQLMPIRDPEIGGVEAKQRWYAFQYGNVRFVGLNTSADACGDYARGEELIPLQDTRCRTDESVTYNERQREFVESALRDAHEEPSVKWIVAYFHSGFYTHGDHAGRKDLLDLWGPYFDEYDVDLVLSGHNHSYERSKPMRDGEVSEAGTTYVVNGTGGSGHYGFRHDEPPEWTAFRDADHYGPVRLDFSEERIRGEYVALDGSVVDEFEIVKRDGEPTQPNPGDAERERLAVAGSRSDDGSTFTGGGTNQIDLAAEAGVPVRLRDVVPAEWDVLGVGHGGEVVERSAPEGYKHVYFDVEPATSPTVTYFVEAPSDADDTGTYEFGPFEAREVNGSGWVAVPGTGSEETVVGEDTTL
jgi:hypothetical protein